MVQRHIIVEKAAPLLASSVSGFYVLARARQLAVAQATEAPLLRFLFGQSDVILIMCGSQALWYIIQRRQHARSTLVDEQYARGPTARAIHQLRQVFTSLLLGTDLLMRKAAAGKTGDIGKLAQRLNQTVRAGLEALAALGDPHPADLIDKRGTPITGRLGIDGTT